MSAAQINISVNTPAVRLIPCLDVDNGRVVKGVRFVDLNDAGDPVEVAKTYDESGADELAFLDITASHENRQTTIDTVRHIAEEISIPFIVGGGIKSLDDIRALLNAGTDKVVINTAAVLTPELTERAATSIGSQCIAVAIDARRCSAPDEPPRWEVYTHGGRKPSGLDALEWAKRVCAMGAGEILLTSMDRDGTKDGFDLELTRTISEALPIPVIASGGVGTLSHLVDGVTEGKADAVLAASIFHYGEYTIGEAKHYMREHGIHVRPDAA